MPKSTSPLRISPNHRYLVDGRGHPVLIHGDTAWSLITALTETETEQYLADRECKGFNAIIVNLIEHKFNGPLTRLGHTPFENPFDLTTPVDAYWEYADKVLQKTARHGLTVFLAPLYLGYNGGSNDEGWIAETLASGIDKCREYGRYLGKRYARFNNLVWMIGGDRNPEDARDHVDALVKGIKEFDDRHLFTAHPAPESSPALEYGWDNWLDINTTYTYQIVHRKLLADYNCVPTRPFVLIESTYEGEHNASAVQIRRQAYWSILCGACGQFLGNRPMWLFDSGWQDALDSLGSKDMVHLKTLFTSRPWYDLVPDQGHKIVTAGLGEFNGLDYLAAASTANGCLLIAYLPNARTITVDLSQHKGESVKCWWYNPRSGKTEAGGKFQALNYQDFSPPGTGDWVFLVDDASLALLPPGV